MTFRTRSMPSILCEPGNPGGIACPIGSLPARSIFSAPGISFIMRGTLNIPTDPGTIQTSFSRPPSSIDFVKMSLGFYLGGMGAKDKNFHLDLARRLGWGAEADKVQELFLAGRRQEAFAAVPDEMADETALLGPPERIRERLAAWKKSPVTTLMVTARDKDTLRLFADALSSRGHTVMAVSDPKEVGGLLSVAQPALILLDIMMPEIDGIELCKRARRMVGDKLPILFLTALNDVQTIRTALAAGGNDYILKGGSLVAAMDRVDSWLARAPAAGQAQQQRAALRKLEGMASAAEVDDGEDILIR